MRMRQYVLFIAIMLWLRAVFSFAQPPSIRFVDQGGKTLSQTAAVVQNETLYLPIDALREAFDPGMKQQYNRLTERLTLALKKKQINLRLGMPSATASGHDEVIPLSHPPLVINQRPMLPITFFTEVLPQVYEFHVSYNPDLQRIRVTEKTDVIRDLLPTPLTNSQGGFLLIIDPGHGDTDTGCRGNGGVLEKDVVFAVAKELEAYCQQNQLRVVLTRDGDFEKRPSERVQTANQSGGQFFLSLHCNAAFSPDAEGVHLYLNNSMGHLQSTSSAPSTSDVLQRREITALSQEDFLEQSRNFASILQEEFESSTGRPAPLTEIPLATLSDVYMPALLIELGYLSNTVDRENLINSASREALAATIGTAILQYSTALNPAQEIIDGG